MTKAIAPILARFAVLAIVGVAAVGAAQAGEPFVAIVQYPEYPAPGQPFRYPGGLIFAACSNGLVLRAKSLSDVGSNLYAANLSKRELEDLASALSPALLDKLRTDCGTMPVDVASHRITIRLGDEVGTLQCFVGVESKALDTLNAAVWNIPMSNARFVGQRPEPLCP